MQHSRFLVLTGHLNDYPLSDLVGILRHQQKTGRLLIEYSNSPASFFFHEGELVDAQLDKLSGLQAVCVALAQPPASFNFNPLIRPTRRSIENSLQKVVSELLGCWGENELDALAAPNPLPQPSLLASPVAATLPVSQTSIDKAPTFLSLPPAPPISYNRPIMAMGAAGLLLLGLSTVIAVTSGLMKRDSTPTVPLTSRQTSENESVTKGSQDLSQNPAKTEFSNSKVKRTGSRGREAALAVEQPTRQDGRNQAVNKQEMKNAEQTVGASSAKLETKAPEKRTNGDPSEIQSVRVVLQIEGGRVAQASIANHRSGMEAYEALALRIARQRRYSSKGSTQEMVTIKLTPPR